MSSETNPAGAIQRIRREAMLERFAGIAMAKFIEVKKTREGRQIACDVIAAWDVAEAMVKEAERRAANEAPRAQS